MNQYCACMDGPNDPDPKCPRCKGTGRHKPRWKIIPYRRNAFGHPLFHVLSPLGRIIRREPFLSIPDAMKAIRQKLDNNA